MKKLIIVIAFLATIPAFPQITLDHEFFNSDPTFSGLLRSVYLTADEMVYASWTADNIHLYDLEYNLIQTIPVAADEVNGIKYITRSLFDCDDSNIEYMVESGSFGNSLIEVFREDGTLLQEIPFGILMTIVPDQTNAFTFPIQSTPNGTKMFVQMIGNGAESTRVYNLCGEVPVPCCTSGSALGTTSVGNHATFRYSSASPNPTFGFTRIQLSTPLSEAGMLKLFNSNGQEVKSIVVTSGKKQFEIDLADLPAGTYLYRIETSSGTKPAGKIVKQ